MEQATIAPFLKKDNSASVGNYTQISFTVIFPNNFDFLIVTMFRII
jgi:hypothetical protein